MREDQTKRQSTGSVFRKLIPYDAFTVKAKSSKTAIVSRLAYHISSNERGGFKGEVNESGFSLQQIPPWYISYPLRRPFLVGRFAEEKDNEIIIKMKILNPLGVGITVLAYLIIGALFLAALLAFLGSGTKPFPLTMFLIAIGALGLLLLSNWGFWSRAKDSKEQLFVILGLTEAAKDMGEFLCPACRNPIHENEERCSNCGWTYTNTHRSM